jgi:hypothetical protein
MDTWNGAQRAWNQHIAQAHERFAAKKAELDTTKAKRTAEHAERDALYAIDYAFAAVEEAEYAALDASLARMEADQLSGAAASSADPMRLWKDRPAPRRQEATCATGPATRAEGKNRAGVLLPLIDRAWLG